MTRRVQSQPIWRFTARVAGFFLSYFSLNVGTAAEKG